MGKAEYSEHNFASVNAKLPLHVTTIDLLVYRVRMYAIDTLLVRSNAS